MSKRLKLGDDKMICGVCAGLADYFNIDSTFFRLAFACGLLATPLFVVIYFLLAIIMPS